MAIDWSKMSDEELMANAPNMGQLQQPQQSQSWENSPVNAPSLTTVQPSQDNLVFTGSNGVENLPAIAAKQNVINQAEVDKQRALMPINIEESAKKKEADLIAARDFARKDFGIALDSFLKVDENIPRGQGYNSLWQGVENWGAGLIPHDIHGRLVNVQDKWANNLKTAIARMRDTGNLNQNEQEAAKQLIPSIWDEQGVAEIKRAYLKQLGLGVNSGNKNLVSEVIDKWMKDPAFDKDKHAQANHANTDVSKYFTRKKSVSGLTL